MDLENLFFNENIILITLWVNSAKNKLISGDTCDLWRQPKYSAVAAILILSSLQIRCQSILRLITR